MSCKDKLKGQHKGQHARANARALNHTHILRVKIKKLRCELRCCLIVHSQPKVVRELRFPKKCCFSPTKSCGVVSAQLFSCLGSTADIGSRSCVFQTKKRPASHCHSSN